MGKGCFQTRHQTETNACHPKCPPSVLSLSMTSLQCAQIMQIEMQHMVSLHLNAAKIGFLRQNEQRNGPFSTAGQREHIGQQLLYALAILYRDSILRIPYTEQMDQRNATLHEQHRLMLGESTEILRGMGNFFQVRFRRQLHKREWACFRS